MQAPPPPTPGRASAPWFPPPTYPPPQPPARRQGGDRNAAVSLSAGTFGIVLALAATFILVLGFAMALPPLAVALGVALSPPGMILGPIAYFVGKAAVRRIDESKGALGGRGTAVAGWVLGVIATAVAAVVTLVWIVVLLEATSTPS